MLQEIKPNSFIYCVPDVLPPKLCTTIIEKFEDDPFKHAGTLGAGLYVDKTIKDSTDLYISGKPEWVDIDQALNHALVPFAEEFVKRHPGLHTFPIRTTGHQIQKTKQGSIGFKPHMDYFPWNRISRQVGFIFYLNSVVLGGHTSFIHQDIHVRPEEGLLLLFPCGFTHYHTGLPACSDKYIATGWLAFIQDN